MKLGELIHSARKRAGLSLHGLGEVVGMSRSYLCEIERGIAVNVGILHAANLCAALDLSLDAMAKAAMESTKGSSND